MDENRLNLNLADIVVTLARVATALELIESQLDSEAERRYNAAESRYRLLIRRAEDAARIYDAIDGEVKANPYGPYDHDRPQRMNAAEARALAAERELEDFAADHPELALELDLEKAE